MTQKFGVHSGQSFYNPLTSVTRLGKNLPLWQNFKSLFIFVSLFRIWQNIKPTLIIILCLWTNFIIDKGPILKKVYSHLVTLIPSPVGEKNLGEKVIFQCHFVYLQNHYLQRPLERWIIWIKLLGILDTLPTLGT